MLLADAVRLPAGVQPLPPVLAQRLQQPVARRPVAAAPRPPPATCPPGGSAGRAPSRASTPAPAHDRLGRLQGEPAGEHRQAVEQRPLRRRRAGRSSSPPPPAGSAGAAAPCGCPRSAAGSGPPAAPGAAPRAARARRAAASSRASGMPSSRRQSSATARRVPVGHGERRAGRSRPARRRAGPPRTGPRRLRRRAPAPGGRAATSEGTRQGVSPAMPSASRLVARRRTSGQARSSASASRAQASSRCSQLSSTSSRRRAASASASVASSGRPGSSRTPTAAATRLGHQRGIGERGQLDQPDAVRVLGRARRPRRAAPAGSCPVPPAPTRVSRGAAGQQALDLGQLALAPDEAGELRRQVVARAGASGRRRPRPRRGAARPARPAAPRPTAAGPRAAWPAGAAAARPTPAAGPGRRADGGAGVGVQVLAHHQQRVVPGEGRRAGGRLVEQAAQARTGRPGRPPPAPAPAPGPRRPASPPPSRGRVEPRRRRPRGRCRSRPASPSSRPRRRRRRGGREQHVLGLDVAVHDALRVGVGQRRRQVARQPRQVVEGQRPARVEALAQRRALDALHDHVQPARLLEGVVDGDDVRVDEARQRPRLRQQPRRRLRRLRRLAAGREQVQRQALDRHRAVEQRVAGGEHLAPAAPRRGAPRRGSARPPARPPGRCGEVSHRRPSSSA